MVEDEDVVEALLGPMALDPVKEETPPPLPVDLLELLLLLLLASGLLEPLVEVVGPGSLGEGTSDPPQMVGVNHQWPDHLCSWLHQPLLSLPPHPDSSRNHSAATVPQLWSL